MYMTCSMYMMYYVCLLWRRGSSGSPTTTHTHQLPRKVKLFCTWWERSFLESSICPICRDGPSRCSSGPRLLGSHPGNETPIVECRQEKDGCPPLLRAPQLLPPLMPTGKGTPRQADVSQGCRVPSGCWGKDSRSEEQVWATPRDTPLFLWLWGA